MTSRLSSVSNSGIRHQQLLGQVLLPTTISLLEDIQVKDGSTALSLNCGEGDVAFRLSEMVGEVGSVIGIDPSNENIHTAQQLRVIKKRENTSFFTSDHYRNGKAEKFDFIHCRLPLLKNFDLQELVAKINEQLEGGGKVFIEVVDFAGFNSIEDNYALSRFKELYASIKRLQWGNMPFHLGLQKKLEQLGFQGIKQHYSSPSFLTGSPRYLPSLTLECIMDSVIDQQLASKEELEVLIYEIKDFEQREHAMISLPGIHQIWGYKGKSLPN